MILKLPESPCFASLQSARIARCNPERPPERLSRLHEVFLGLGPDPAENIRRLTEACGGIPRLEQPIDESDRLFAEIIAWAIGRETERLRARQIADPMRPSRGSAVEPQLEAMIDASPFPIAVTDIEDRVSIWTRASEQLWGRSREEVLGEGPGFGREGIRARVASPARRRGGPDPS